MKNLIYYLIVLMMFTGSSCKQEMKSCEKLKLHVDAMNIISTYVKEHPQYNTFLLESTQDFEQNENLTIPQGFLLGPGYRFLIEERNLIHYFDVLDRRIFYNSPVDKLMQTNENKWIIKIEPNSIKLNNGWVIKDFLELFIFRSIYFYYNEVEILEVNLRPDTIFAPQCLESTIQFVSVP